MRKLATAKSDSSVSWSFVILLTCSGKAQEMLRNVNLRILYYYNYYLFFYFFCFYMRTYLRFPYIKTSFDSFTADSYYINTQLYLILSSEKVTINHQCHR